jgi:hypothetical protein
MRNGSLLTRANASQTNAERAKKKESQKGMYFTLLVLMTSPWRLEGTGSAADIRNEISVRFLKKVDEIHAQLVVNACSDWSVSSDDSHNECIRV